VTTDASKKASNIPTGLEITPMSEAYRERPHPILDELRVEEPVHYNELLEQWVLTRHEDVEQVLQDRDLFVDPRKMPSDSRRAQRMREIMAEDEGEDDRGPSMLMLDPPDHDRLRGLVNRAFTPRAVEKMRPRAQAIADELLDKVQDNQSFDIIGDFSAPLPTIVIAEMLGVDPAFQAEFKRLSDIGVQGLNPFLDKEGRKKVRAAGAEIDTYLVGAIEERRKGRKDDLISGLIDAEEDGEKLTNDEVIRTVGLLLAAGNLTTTDLIGNGMLALLSDRSQFEKLRDDPSLIVNAVEEMIRFDPPVMNSGRITLEDMEVGGCPIPAGSSFSPSLAGANHDPTIHPNPHKFDIEREEIHHQSFGGGRRYCLGAPLARLETQVAITTLARRFPNLRLADQEIEHRTLPGFRGLKKLIVQT
jgi:cytochrome P450